MDIIDSIIADNRVELRMAPVNQDGHAVGVLKIVEGRIEQRGGQGDLLVTGINVEWAPEEIWSDTFVLRVWGYSKLTRMLLFRTESDVHCFSNRKEVLAFGEF